MIINLIPGELYYISDRANKPVMFLGIDDNPYYVKVLDGSAILTVFRASLLERSEVEKYES